MPSVSDLALALFETEYPSLWAIVEKRIQLEWSSHRDKNLEKGGFHLIDYAVHFGRLIRVIYRYQLIGALRKEFLWYVNLFKDYGWGQDALSLILDSWIIAIQGLIKQPECNELAEPLQSLKIDLPDLFAAAGVSYGSSPHAFASLLVEPLINGDIQEAQKLILSTWPSISSPDRLIVEILLPVIREIGNLWERHQIEIYQEHLATQALKVILLRLPALKPPSLSPKRYKALVTCTPGDEHDLVPWALSSYLETKGWAVQNLGGSLPVDQIIAAARALRPDVLFITLTMLILLEDFLKVLDGLHENFPSCRVIVGGRGTISAQALLESQGAIVAKDFEQGHQMALRVVGDA